MSRFLAVPFAFALALAPVCTGLLAQPAPAASAATRAEIKMERAEFLKTHMWDASNEVWVLKPGFEAPAGMKTRAQIKAERDEFLRNNRWDESTSRWLSLKGTPREMSTMSRAQVKTETKAFLRTHRFDEQTEAWVDKESPKAK